MLKRLAMKKVFFATLTVLLALHLDCAAQWSECFNYKGAWSQWSKTYGKISMYEDDSGIVLKTSGGLVYFKFQINNYVPPTKAELRAHRKSDEWFIYTGTVEYSVGSAVSSAPPFHRLSFADGGGDQTFGSVGRRLLPGRGPAPAPHGRSARLFRRGPGTGAWGQYGFRFL